MFYRKNYERSDHLNLFANGLKVRKMKIDFSRANALTHLKFNIFELDKT